MKTLHRTILLLGLMLATGSRVSADTLRNVQPGQPVPDYSLKTMGGQTIESTALRGKAIVLVFVSAEQRSSESAAADAHTVVRALDRDDLVLLFVTADVSRTGYFRKYRDAAKIHEPLGLDFDRKLYGALGLIVQPTTIVIDRDGKLARVVSSYKSDYAHVLDTYCRHTLGTLDDAGLARSLAAERFERDRPADRIARHRAAAGLLRKNGLLTDTENELRAALAIDPSHVDTRLDLAALYVAMTRIDDARGIVEAILDEQPSQRRANLLHGIVLYHAGALGEAEAVLTKALLLNPDPEMTHYYLGLIHEKKGDKGKAITHFKEALSRLLMDRAM